MPRSGCTSAGQVAQQGTQVEMVARGHSQVGNQCKQKLCKPQY